MRTITAAAFIAFAAVAALAASPAPWTTVETTHIGADTLTVQRQASDNGDVMRLVITAAGVATTVYGPENGVATVKDAVQTRSLAAQNKLKSKYLFATDALKDRATGDRLVMAFGVTDGEDPSPFHLMHLGVNGQIQTLLDLDMFELTAIVDLNKDGVPELVGRPTYSQMDTACLSTYDPRAVYRLSGGKYVYDEALSKTYNLTHRYVWAGPNSREDVAVDLCRKAGPRLAAAPKD